MSPQAQPPPMTHDPSVAEDGDTSPSFAWGGGMTYRPTRLTWLLLRSRPSKYSIVLVSP